MNGSQTESAKFFRHISVCEESDNWTSNIQANLARNYMELLEDICTWKNVKTNLFQLP